jgi:hypothetical protein
VRPDVDAGDQQHGRDGAQQDQGDGTKFAEELFVERDHFDAVAGVLTVGSGVRMLGFVHVFGGDAEGGLRRFERDARLEPGDHAGGIAPTGAGVERDGDPEVDGAGSQSEVEVGGQDADDAAAGLSKADGLPDDGGIAAEAAEE